MSSTPSFRPAIMSASLGRARHHDFETKVRAASEAGFQGIEIFYEDIEHFAANMSSSYPKPYTLSPPPTFLPSNPSTDIPILLEAATKMRQILTNQKNNPPLTVICLQPFLFYEGLASRSQQKKLAEEKLRDIWFRLAEILDTDLIQIPANFLSKEECVGDMDIIVSDLRELADLGLEEKGRRKDGKVVRFAYEALCWGTWIDTWEGSWDVCMKVDRENFGVVLDTFNIAGRVWGDPQDGKEGKVVGGEEELRRSLERLVKEGGGKLREKLFYLQVVDAERVRGERGLREGHEWFVEGQPARMSWSRNARAFFEEGRGGGDEEPYVGYLPVEEVARTVIQGLGYKGWVSMELFSRSMEDPREEVPVEHAKRGIKAWGRFKERLGLDV